MVKLSKLDYEKDDFFETEIDDQLFQFGLAQTKDDKITHQG